MGNTKSATSNRMTAAVATMTLIALRHRGLAGEDSDPARFEEIIHEIDRVTMMQGVRCQSPNLGIGIQPTKRKRHEIGQCPSGVEWEVKLSDG